MRVLVRTAAASLLLLIFPLAVSPQAVVASWSLPNQNGAVSTTVSLLDTPAGLAVDGVPLGDALTQLRFTSGVSVAFSPTLVPIDTRVSCDCRTVSVREALFQLLDGLPVRPVLMGDVILIEPLDWVGDRSLLAVGEARLASLPLSVSGRTLPADWNTAGGALGSERISTVPGPSARDSRKTLQTGAIQGTVWTLEGGQRFPLPHAQVTVTQFQRGTVTNLDGVYRIEGIQAGEHELRVQFLGYSSLVRRVVVRASETVTADFELQRSVIDMDEIVVTGVATATTRAKLPFTVERLTAEAMPVPSATAAGLLQGKIAGATVIQTNPRPGSPPSVLLRGPTSINNTGRNQEPLYIVDGNVLGESLVDLDALDIESIEVVKGAAASSLYGSRAGNGVIQITTRRGRDAEMGTARYTMRSEVGQSRIRENFDQTSHHIYQLTPDGRQFIDGTTGMPCDFADCHSLNLAGQRAGSGEGPNNWNTFMDQPYPVVYDNVGEVFNQGGFQQHNLTISGRTGGTNYHLSYSHLRDQGIVVYQDGFRRNNFRLNFDQSITPELSLEASALYSKSRQDLMVSSGGVFHRVVRQPVGGNLRERDEDGNYRLLVDPINKRDNPLIELSQRDWWEARSRIMASSQVRYNPLAWLRVEGSMSLDRLDTEQQDFRDRGYPTDRPEPVNDGHLSVSDHAREAINANVDVVLSGSREELAGRVRGRWLFEHDNLQRRTISGFGLAAKGVPSIENFVDPIRVTRSHQDQTIRSSGVFLSAGGDFRDRYIADLLVRRDGSSLFGSEARWQTYFRGAGAWRMAQEAWFPIDALNEFKLRYSYGQAGGRPNFFAQYETFDVAAGVVRPLALGNRELRPELIKEHEFGLDILALQRATLSLVYARTSAEDQILPVPLSSVVGYRTQWRNVGTLESNTFEATFGLDAVQRVNLTWNHQLTLDRTTNVVSHLGEGILPFRMGHPGQGMGAVFYVREGESLGTFFGTRYVTKCLELPAEVQPFCNAHFDLNDDGVLVYVGEGNTWRSGLWGQSAELAGRTYRWGLPISGAIGIDRVTGEETTYLPLGKTTPDFTLNWSSTLRWGNFSAYALLSWVQGFDVFNRTVSWSMMHHMSKFQDQAGKPEDEKKPVGYYDAIQGMGFWVEDASYQKLREVAVSYLYRPGAGPLQRFSSINLMATGRNLFTWTNYRGYDPDVGQDGGEMGSGVLARSDIDGYPNFRTLSFAVEVVF